MAASVTGRVSAVPQSNLHQQDLTKLDVTKLSALSPEVISRQATINIGTIGHVAHGKSTVVKAVSGVQTVRFKNELERNITIKLVRLSEDIVNSYSTKSRKRNYGSPCISIEEPKKKKSREGNRQKNGEYVIEDIVDQKIYYGIQWFFVKWKDWPHSANTWEPLEHLGNCSKILSQFIDAQYEHNLNDLEKLKEELSFGDLLKLDILENLFKSEGSRQLDDADKDLKLNLLGLFNLPQNEENYVDLLVTKARSSIQKYELASRRKMQLTMLKEWEVLLNTVDTAGMLQVENEFDLSLPPEKFDYINKSVPGEGVIIPDEPPIWCKCNPCNAKSKCGCGSQGGHFAYFSNKRLRVAIGTPIYECNKLCTCKEDCNNRVVQNGRNLKLCIFRTNTGCGWGVRSVHRIKTGQFVCQYVGEVITSEEAEKRGKTYDQNGLTYLFDLDFNASESYTIDAAYMGNVSHFINHSCDPNLGVWAVWGDCLDPNLPMLALFATKDIEPGEELCFDYNTDKSNEPTEIDNNRNVNNRMVLAGSATSIFDSPVKENKPPTSPFKLRSPMKVEVVKNHAEFKHICKCNSIKCRGYLFSLNSTH